MDSSQLRQRLGVPSTATTATSTATGTRQRAAAGRQPSQRPSSKVHPQRNLKEPTSFVDFLSTVTRWICLPVTYPLHLFLTFLTSPLTLSLTLRLILLTFLLLVSFLTSSLAVGTFYWKWGRAGEVELEGWLIYGSRSNPTPYSVIAFPTIGKDADRVLNDVKYEVEVELELVRPQSRSVYGEGMGNFMITLEFLSEKTNDPVMVVSQPCLPALPLSTSYFPSFIFNPFKLLSPYTYLNILTYPFSSKPQHTLRHSLTFSNTERELDKKQHFLLTRPMVPPTNPITLRPSRGGDKIVGAVKVLVGREDGCSSYSYDQVYGGTEDRRYGSRGGGGGGGCEVKTTGWVIVRFIPKATGLRWLLQSYPIIPLLVLPPIALGLTIASALLAFLIVMWAVGGGIFPSASNHITSGTGNNTPTEKPALGDGSSGGGPKGSGDGAVSDTSLSPIIDNKSDGIRSRPPSYIQPSNPNPNTNRYSLISNASTINANSNFRAGGTLTESPPQLSSASASGEQQSGGRGRHSRNASRTTTELSMSQSDMSESEFTDATGTTSGYSDEEGTETERETSG